jgi:hypothetical protein
MRITPRVLLLWCFFGISLAAVRHWITYLVPIADEKQRDFFESPLPEFYPGASVEFDYPLSCKQPPLILSHKRNYQVALVYHVGMLKNWKNVVADQLRTLSKCGLGKIASSFVVSYSNGDPTELRQLFNHYNLARNLQLVKALKMPWEEEAMLATSRLCAKAKQPTTVFYFHSKGTSKFDESWRDQLNQSWSYSRSLYWRKFMEYFTLERPHLCLQKIVNQGASTCGIMMRYPSWHYSGNFWAASCDYINTVRPINSTWCQQADALYNCAEIWLGSGIDGDKLDRAKFVDLHPDAPDLYNELILPEMYANGTL